jgi:hypothetical protein
MCWARSIAICVAAFVLCARAAAQTTASWSSAASGNWTDPTKWSTNPDYPNNGTPSGSTYWANIAAAGSPYQISLTTPITLTGATLSSPDATVNHTGSTVIFTDALNLNAGTWVMSGFSTTLSGTINGGGGIISVLNGAGVSLDGVTLGAPLQAAAGINTTNISVFNDLTLNDATISLTTARLTTSGNSQIKGTGTIVLSGGSLAAPASGTLTLGSGVVVSGSGTVLSNGSGFVNHGAMTAATSGAKMIVSAPYFNDGTFAANSGGTMQVRIDNTTTQAGTVVLSGSSTLNLTGNVTEVGLGTFIRSGGTVNIQHLDNTGRTTALNAFGGGWNLYSPFFPGPGAIIGGTITIGGGIQQLPVTSDGLLQDVYFDAGMIVSPSQKVFIDNVTLNGTVSLQGASKLTFVGIQTLNGSAQIRFDGPSDLSAFNTITDDTAGTKFTFGPSVYIRTGTGSGTIGDPTFTVRNEGEISARTNGQQIHLAAGTFENAGLLSAFSGGTIKVDHLVGDAGSFGFGSSGAIDLNGSYSFSQPVNVIDMAALTLRGDWSSTALIRANHGTINFATITPSISQVSLGTSTMGLLFDTTTPAAIALPYTNTAIRMAEGATLDNTGQTLNLGGRTSDLQLDNGRLKGGAVTGTGEILIDRGGGTLDAVTSAASISFLQTNSTLTIANGLTLNNASLSLFTSNLQSAGTQTLGGTGVISIEPGTSTIQSTSGTLTLGSGITTRTHGGSGSIGVGGSNIVNLGTISAQSSGQTIQVGSLVINSGTIEARNGGTIALPYTSLTQHPNFNRGTLTSGHWAVFNNSSISLGTSISRNDADVLLSGPNASFGGMSSLRINTGTFALDAGQVFTTPTSFLNVGTVRVGDGSVFRVAGTLTNSGTIDLNEFMIVDYAAGTASPIDTIRQQILAGRNGGSWDAAGIIDSNARTNSSLRVGFADANQKFTNFPATFANQSVDDSAILLRETYGGDANLDGAVNIVDFNLLATSFGKTSRYWYNGDFTYDGNVTISDFNILATNFGKNLNALASPAQAPAALRITAESAAAIPLPSQVWTALATVAIAIAIGRTRFRSRCS